MAPSEIGSIRRPVNDDVFPGLSFMMDCVRQRVSSYLEDFQKHRSEIAFVHTRGLRIERWTYGRVASMAARCARELEERQIGRGDRVVIWGANSPEWVAVFYGCLL